MEERKGRKSDKSVKSRRRKRSDALHWLTLSLFVLFRTKHPKAMSSIYYDFTHEIRKLVHRIPDDNEIKWRLQGDVYNDQKDRPITKDRIRNAFIRVCVDHEKFVPIFSLIPVEVTRKEKEYMHMCKIKMKLRLYVLKDYSKDSGKLRDTCVDPSYIETSVGMIQYGRVQANEKEYEYYSSTCPNMLQDSMKSDKNKMSFVYNVETSLKLNIYRYHDKAEYVVAASSITIEASGMNRKSVGPLEEPFALCHPKYKIIADMLDDSKNIPNINIPLFEEEFSKEINVKGRLEKTIRKYTEGEIEGNLASHLIKSWQGEIIGASNLYSAGEVRDLILGNYKEHFGVGKKWKWPI